MNVYERNGAVLPSETMATHGLHEGDLLLAAQTDACVLLTGRRDYVEGLAFRIHTMSGWCDGAFLVIDCGSTDEVVCRAFETALPVPDRPPLPASPYPRRAQAATVFLREVGKLNGTLQSLLTDRLEKVRGPVQRARRRVIASTSMPLLPRVRNGTFDERLFYRLNVIHLVADQVGLKPDATGDDMTTRSG